MNIDYTAVILAIISLLGVLLTRVLVPFLQAKLTEKQIQEVSFWVEVAVVAAEKAFEGQSGYGMIKKAQVIKFVKDMGLPVSEEQLEVLIDAVVEELINTPYELLIE